MGDGLSEATLGEELDETAAAVDKSAISEVLFIGRSGLTLDCIHAVVTGNHSLYQIWESSVFFQHQRQTTKDAGGVRLRSRDVSMMA